MTKPELLHTVVPREGGYELICSCGPRAWSVYAALCRKGANRREGWSGSVNQLAKIIPYISRSTIRRVLLRLEEEGVIQTKDLRPWRAYRIKWGPKKLSTSGQVCPPADKVCSPADKVCSPADKVCPPADKVCPPADNSSEVEDEVEDEGGSALRPSGRAAPLSPEEIRQRKADLLAQVKEG